MFAKIISKKWEEGRNMNQVRNRNSQRVQDLRRSRRSAVLNLLRQVEIPKEKKKKTAQEEKIERLKAYKVEKQKKMEELKKTQRPPFHSIVKIRHTGSTPYREHPVSKLQEKKLDKNGKPHVTGLFGASSSNTFKPTNSKSNEIKKPVKPNDKKDKPKINDAPSRNAVKPMASRNNEIKDPLKQNGIKKVVERKKGKENKLETKQAPVVSTSNIKNPTKPVSSTSDPTTKNPVIKNTRPQRAVQTRRINSKPPVAKSPVKVLTDVINTGVQTRNARKTTMANRKLATRITRQQNGQLSNCSDSKGSSEEEVTKQEVNVKQKKKSIKVNKQEQEIKVEDREIDAEIEDIEIDAEIENKETDTDKVDKEMDAKKEDIETITPAVLVESSIDLANGTAFHRQRLQNTIDRLSKEADSWEIRKEDNLSDLVKDEILSVVGQTRLLISKRLSKFKGLVDRCEFPLPEQLKITLEDLDGYWEVMYQQVDQLDQKYANLRDLESNNWQEKVVAVTSKPMKKGGPKKKSVNKPATKSRFKEFLKSKQNETKEVPSEPEIPVTPGGQSVRNGDTTQSSLYMSASKGEEMEFGSCSKLENLRTPTKTPAMKRALFPSRRSSAALITINRRSFMKF